MCIRDRAYDRMAKSYYILMHLLIPALSLWTEPLARSRWVGLLGLRRGDVVLDVATGAGRNLPFLLKRVGREGMVLGMDISKSMLSLAARQARARGWRNVELQRANASYLPYKDEVFDAVFHVGGVNTFEEKARALAEMVRVARPGARLVVVDEGLEPGKRQTFRGRFLLRMNALYASLPPLAELPEELLASLGTALASTVLLLDGQPTAFQHVELEDCHVLGLAYGPDEHEVVLHLRGTMDDDGDGLANYEELLLGTDPGRADTDRDLWPDGVDPWPRSPLVPNGLAAIPGALALALAAFAARRLRRRPAPSL